MKNKYFALFFVCICLFLTACSNKSESIASSSDTIFTEEDNNNSDDIVENSIQTTLDPLIIDDEYTIRNNTQDENNLSSQASEKRVKTIIYSKIKKTCEETFKTAFSNYFNILGFEYSFYKENINPSNLNTEVEFTLTINYKNFDIDPDTVDYIANAKKNNSTDYKRLYDDYLSPQTMSFSMLGIANKNENITLYANISPNSIPVYMPVQLFFPDSEERIFIPYDAEKILCKINEVDVSNNKIIVTVYPDENRNTDYSSMSIDENLEQESFDVNGYIQIDVGEDTDGDNIIYNLTDLNSIISENKNTNYFFLYTLYGEVYAIEEINEE